MFSLKRAVKKYVLLCCSTAGKKVAFPPHIEPCIHSARPPAGRPHTGLEAEQLAVRLEGEAMPAHTVKLAAVYANYTTKKNPDRQ